MAMQVKVGSFTQIAGAGSQAITGVGFQPKAIIFYFSTTTAPWRGDIYMGIGFTTGPTESFALGGSSRDNVASSINARRMAAKAISQVDGNLSVHEADLTSFDADGFTLNWGADGSGVGNTIVNYIALGGTDLTNAKAMKWDAGAATGNQAVSGVGFQPGLVMHAGYGNQATALPNSSDTFSFSIGVMDSAGNQWATALRGDNGVNPSNTARNQRTDSCFLEIFSNSNTNARLSFVSMDADGFTVNRNVAPGVAQPVISLCLKGPNFKAGSFAKDTGASPDAQSVTGIGFPPKGLILSSVKNGANPTPAVHSLWSFGAASGAADERGIAVRDEDNVSPTDAQSHQSSSVLTLVDTTAVSTVTDQLDLTSFDPDGFSGSWTTNSATAHEILYIAVGDTNFPPNAPTLDSPAEGAVLNATQSNAFQFDATDPDAGDTMSAWALKVTIQGTTRWWNATTNSWSATEHFNTEGSPPPFPIVDKQIVIPANEFDDFFA